MENENVLDEESKAMLKDIAKDYVGKVKELEAKQIYLNAELGSYKEILKMFVIVGAITNEEIEDIKKSLEQQENSH